MDLEKHDWEKELETKNRRQNYLFVGSIIVVVIGIIVLFAFLCTTCEEHVKSHDHKKEVNKCGCE